MASKTDMYDLKDEVTCPVCLEIFTDPQALTCLHTSCLHCLKSIAGTSLAVACPICRAPTLFEDLRNDFRVRRSMDRYQRKEQEKVNGSCELCEEKTAIYKCHKCKRLICPTCQKVHVKVSNCQDDDSVTLASLSKSSLDASKELKEWKKKLNKQATTEQKSYNKVMKKMEDQRQEALKNIDSKNEEALKHFRNERQKVNSNIDETKTIRTTEHEEYQKQIKERINYINTMEQADENTIYQLFGSIIDELKKELDQLQSTSFSVTEMTITNKEFDKEKEIQVILTKRKQLNPLLTEELTINYDALLEKNLIIQQKVDLPGWVGKMLVLNDELLCLLWNRIEAYHLQTGQHKRTVTTRLKMPRSMTITSTGHLLVTTGEEGLLEFDLQGSLLHSVNTQPHWDATAVGERVVALRVEDGLIHIDEYDSSMQRISATATPVKDDGTRITCAVANRSVYICSAGQNCICHIDFNKSGMFQTHGRKGSTEAGLLNSPYLCCADGKILVIADYDNNRMQTLDSGNNEWNVLDIPGLKHPLAAVVDSEGRLLVSGWCPYNLCIIH